MTPTAIATSPPPRVPALRVHARNDAAPRPDGDYVLYWMIMARRPGWNFALERALDWARALGRPLVVFEALRCGYRWASDRLHKFILEGMGDNARRFEGTSALYFPYVEPAQGAGKELLARLAARACVVVSDDFPCFMLPRMVAAAARQITTRFELVDSNGLLPMRAAPKAYTRAFDFRRFLQKSLPEHLTQMPKAQPLHGVDLPVLARLPADIVRRWPGATAPLLAGDVRALAALPIDHSVGPAAVRGGVDAATTALESFVRARLADYADQRNQPEQDATSGFSPYLHFGHLSVHQVLARIAEAERWSPQQLAPQASGRKDGWWNMSAPAEAFLDQLVTWRELGYNMCAHRPDDYDRYESLPAWARATLAAHAGDERVHCYTPAELEEGRTHDALWNAAHGQLVRDGWFHNHMRMLWAKKIVEWSRSPEEALHAMIELMNKYSLDGRNPNSYSGYFWTLGRYDRPWYTERPIFGRVRTMDSGRTARKVRVRGYIERYAP